jgi:hypothetical protein
MKQKLCACGGDLEPYGRRDRCHKCRKRHEQQMDAIKNPAHQAVAAAIKAGKLSRLDGSVPCVDCGKPATHYDHREYAKPLEVDPVCRSCNIRRGPAKDIAELWIKKAPANSQS